MTAMLTRTMTATQARELTQDLLHEHGLKGWAFKFDNAKRRAGQCSYSARTISLSRHLLAQRSYEDTLNTITHEVAHALVGAGHGHDQVWARKHRELGGDGRRCFEMEGIDPTAPWVGTCGHGKQFARYRQPKRLEGWRCRCRQGSSPVVWERKR
ncbi:SprT-like protease [Mycobacterium phage KittenMittens]|nr:SprT-like protease [Mycobacterium phage KittenMittens]